MIFGDIRHIDLSTSSFERMITENCLYVDKTRMIENFLTTKSDVQLITRHRRLGKSLNMDMLRCFLTDKQDCRPLFKGMYIEKSPVWEKAHSAPVFVFDFKELTSKDYEKQIKNQTIKNLFTLGNPKEFSGFAKYCSDGLFDDSVPSVNYLQKLTEIAHEITGKRAYILIDEYDNLLMKIVAHEKYDEIRNFFTNLFSAAVKGNLHLEKALITGVMRISHESLFSGLNNIVNFDMFNDDVFTNDYGLTEDEAKTLCTMAQADLAKLKAWYNGVKINGEEIFNTYSTMSYFDSGRFDCYWGRSGTLDMIVDLLNNDRRQTIEKLLNSEAVEKVVEKRISLKQLLIDNSDEAFYSLLVQAGYLAAEIMDSARDTAILTIPNTELKLVWKKFILSTYYPSSTRLRTLFDNEHDPEKFADDIQDFLTDSLSYHDLAVQKGETKSKVHETLYHVFILGILSAY